MTKEAPNRKKLFGMDYNLVDVYLHKTEADENAKIIRNYGKQWASVKYIDGYYALYSRNKSLGKPSGTPRKRSPSKTKKTLKQIDKKYIKAGVKSPSTYKKIKKEKSEKKKNNKPKRFISQGIYRNRSDAQKELSDWKKIGYEAQIREKKLAGELIYKVYSRKK